MGRLAFKERRQYQVQELQTTHREVLRRLLLGEKAVDIANDLNLSPVTVSYTKHSELGKMRMQELEAARDDDAVSVARHIKKLAPVALGVIEAMLTGSDPDAPLVKPETKLRAAQDILDRAGHGAVQKIQSTSVVVTGEALAEIKRRARESGVMVDATASVEVKGEQG